MDFKTSYARMRGFCCRDCADPLIRAGNRAGVASSAKEAVAPLYNFVAILVSCARLFKNDGSL
jgi:hypothetical protein